MLEPPLSSCTSKGPAKSQEPLEREEQKLSGKLWVMPTSSWGPMGSYGNESTIAFSLVEK